MGDRTPPRRWHRRGHPIVKFADGRWRWAASGRYLRLGSNSGDPPCARCHRPPTSDGYDPCLGWLPGAISACCGHGVSEGHVTYVRGEPLPLPRLRGSPGPPATGQVHLSRERLWFVPSPTAGAFPSFPQASSEGTCALRDES